MSERATERDESLDLVADGLAPIASHMAGEDGFPDREAQAVLDWIYDRRHERPLPVRGCTCDHCHAACHTEQGGQGE